MLIALKYWQPILSAIVMAILSYVLHSVDVSFLESRHRSEMASQAQELKAACEKDKLITQKANDDLQKAYSSTAKRLNELKRLSPKCIPITESPKPSSSGGKHA